MEPEQIRCFCRRSPLLAICGRDSKSGEPFVHVKVFRQDRIYAEVVVSSGVVRLHCRECLRWHKVTIKRDDVDRREEPLPGTVDLSHR